MRCRLEMVPALLLILPAVVACSRDSGQDVRDEATAESSPPSRATSAPTPTSTSTESASPTSDPSVVELGVFGSLRPTRGWRSLSLASVEKAARETGDPDLDQLADSLRSGKALAALNTVDGSVSLVVTVLSRPSGNVPTSVDLVADVAQRLGQVEAAPRLRTRIDGRPAVRLALASGPGLPATESIYVVSLGALVLMLQFTVTADQMSPTVESRIATQAAAVDLTY